MSITDADLSGILAALAENRYLDDYRLREAAAEMIKALAKDRDEYESAAEKLGGYYERASGQLRAAEQAIEMAPHWAACQLSDNPECHCWKADYAAAKGIPQEGADQ